MFFHQGTSIFFGPFTMSFLPVPVSKFFSILQMPDPTFLIKQASIRNIGPKYQNFFPFSFSFRFFFICFDEEIIAPSNQHWQLTIYLISDSKIRKLRDMDGTILYKFNEFVLVLNLFNEIVLILSNRIIICAEFVQ